MKNISVEKKSFRIVFMALIGVVTFLVTSWTLRSNFYFLFDDIAWLKEVKFSFDVTNFFHILPNSRYNDRPLRTFWFWCLYQLFGMNYTAYYLVVLLWHVLDTYLVYILISKMLKLVGQDKNVIFGKSACVALFFGLYPKNLMAVYWLAGAANDLLCAFFSLLTMICYLNYVKNRKSFLSIILFLIFYIGAMRSKEAAICLPLIIFLYECYLSFHNKEKIKIRLGNIVLIMYMIIYLIRLFTLPAGLTTEGQYEQNFSIITIFKVLLNYIRMYFAWDDGGFSYNIDVYYTKIGNIGIVVCLLILVNIVKNLIRKKDIEKNVGFILLWLCAGLSLAPLLVLPNIQHLLYFYFPAIFLSMLFGLVIYDGIMAVFNHKYITYILLTTMMVVFVILNNVGGAKKFRENFIRWGEEAKSTVADIEKIEKLPVGTHLYLYGTDTGANVFNYAPGYIVNILYDDPTIISEIANDEIEYMIPYAVWEYSDGHVIEVERVEK